MDVVKKAKLSRETWARIRLFAMDVDGILTDGTVSISSDGTETKRFSIIDGLGLSLLRDSGLQLAWISGRQSAATTYRAAELRIPHVIQGRLDKQPVRRGITRVRELLEAGVNVSYGQDCVDDPFYPFGRVDPLEVALVMAHAAHLTKPSEIECVFSMQNWAAAKVLRLDDYGFVQGAVGDLVLLDAFDAAQAIRERADRMVVVKRGRIVAETTTTRRVHRHAN